MNTNEKLTEVLNDLIQINNDRVAGYEKAIVSVDASDISLKATFRKMADKSEGYRSALAAAVANLGGKPASGTTSLGKIYRAWMEVKNTFTGDDRQSVLDSCEGGEDAALKAYKEALGSDVEMQAETRQLLISQQAELKIAHDMIKQFRDLHTHAHS
jgi:uncharacterized protein (TIGR02284 family)